MSIFEITTNSLIPLSDTSFGAEGIYERKDIQRLLKQNISVLSNDLMVITEEYGEWVESNRRIDLLCIDTNANLVVVELKRTDDGGHMELQAIRYAAMISKLTFRQLVQAHQEFLAKNSLEVAAAESSILGFLRWDEPNEEAFANEVRIILASADFTKELTTTVMWLNEHDVDVSCIRMRPYRLQDGRLLLDVQQIIPLPEAMDYQTQIREKEQAGRQSRSERYDIRYKFWEDLLSFAKTKTELHSGRKAGIYGWIGGSIGRSGLQLNYATRGNDSQVEFYIDFGDDEKNLSAFNQLKAHEQEIEQVFGGKLEWQELPESRGCRIRKVVQGGWKSEREEWPAIHQQLVDGMIALEKAFKPYVSKIKV